MAKRRFVLLAIAIVGLMVAGACTASVDEDVIAESSAASRGATEAEAVETTTDVSEVPAPASDEDGDGDGGAPRGDFSVLDSLAKIPASAGADARTLQVSVGDIEAAADQARLRPPLDVNDMDDLVEFFGPLTGFSPEGRPLRVFVPLPRLLRDGAIGRLDEFTAELGFSPGEVTSFAALESSPGEFVVVSGVTGPSDLPVVAPGVSTLGEGDDFSLTIDGATAARPLGRPLRLGQRDDDLALSQSTPAMVDWLDGSAATLADDAGLAALATRLDEEEVVAAFLLTREANYRAVGLGWRAGDDGPRGVIVLSYETEATATAALEGVTAALVGESAVTGLPMSDLVTVERIEARGAEIVASLEFAAERDPETLFTMLVRGDGPFAP